jgi:hypothetical protein
MTKRTRLRVCQAKQRYPDSAAAGAVAARHEHAVRPYCCDRCLGWHLTSRLKGKWMSRPGFALAKSIIAKIDGPNAPQAGLPTETPSGSA